MSKNWIKNINTKNLLSKASLLLTFFLFSCTDTGCIDADDFGEYESETIEIQSNASAGDCTHYPALELIDPSQGSGLKACFTEGVANTQDYEGNLIASDADDDENHPDDTDYGGCAGYLSESIKNICIQSCIDKCLLENTSDSGLSQPNWNSTNSRSSSINSGVTIRPNSEIMVTALGEINFGDNIEYESAYIDVQELVPHTKNSSGSDIFFNVKNGQILNLNFSSQWSNGTADFGGNVPISNSGNTASDISIYNSTKRLVAYATSYPEGHSFNSNAADIKTGSLGTPLLPDPYAWTCAYLGNDKTEATCGHKVDSYTSIGYTNVSNDLAEAAFPVSSTAQSAGLTTYGGFIRWDGDGLQNTDYDPFSINALSCRFNSNSNLECDDASGLGLEGEFADENLDGDPDSETDANGNDLDNEITISHPGGEYSYEVSFKSLAPPAAPDPITGVITGSACDFDGVDTAGFKVRVEDEYGLTLDSTKVPDSNGNEVLIAIDDNWSTYKIALEPNQSIKIPKIDIIGKEHCRLAIATRFLRYHDLKIQTSGFINFTTLNASSGNCNLKGRIINPTGSHSKDSFKIEYNDAGDPILSSITGFSSDFYEYDNFTISPSLSTDPLSHIVVAPSTNSTLSTLNWGDSVFVRKGQVIRFSPHSWNQTFTTTNGLERTCGIGMAMRIIPRPAMLCRGKNSEFTQNQNCTPEFDEEYNIIGCSANAAECLDDTGSSFCLTPACRAEIVCPVDGMIPGAPGDTGGPYYAKTCNNIPLDGNNHITPSDDAACDASYASDSSDGSSEADADRGACTSCSQAMLTAARQPSKIEVADLDQCYDLENYRGKVSNIPITTGFTDLENTAETKGAEILGAFNGKYGNFTNFYDTKESDISTGNRVFQLSTPLIFSNSSRMQFFVLDGDNFNDDFTGAAGRSSVYDNNSGGYKVNATATLTSTNGEWLQMNLCQDDGSDLLCDNVNLAPQVSNQPTGITIDRATSSVDSPVLTSGSSYRFDGYGNLVRTASPSAAQGDCDLTKAGAYFYCHTVPDNGNDIANLRLSFQIVDPEEANCDIDNPTSTDSAAYDGVILSNPRFDSTDTNNNNAICPADTAATPLTTCKKELYCSNKYANNTGSYFVKVKVKNTSSDGAASIIESVIEPIVKVMDGDRKDCSTTGLEIGTDGTKTKNNRQPTYDNNGAIIDNSGVYDPTNANNIGAVCTLADYQAKLCVGEFYCKAAQVGQAERIYKLLIADSRYKAIVTISLVMMVTFYGLTFLMGVSEINHAELVNRVIKIGLIYLFIGEAGWQWFDTFVVKFFKDGTDYLAFLMASSFDTSGEISRAIDDGNYYDKSVLFSSVDNVFNLFFSDAVLKKISALLFASIFGWAYLLIICLSFMLYVYAVANAVLLYLTAQVFISILFTLGPIFFIFTLFEKTKEMFDNWIKQLIGFSLQQIFLLTTLAFFNMMMYEVIKMSLGFKICWDDVWTINIIVRISLLSWWNIASLPPRTDSQSEVGNIGNPEGIPSLFTILFIWIIASLMNKFIGFMTELASQISGGLSATSLSAGVSSAVSEVKKSLKSSASDFAEKRGINKKFQEVDRALFGSGKLADADRAKAKETRKLLGSQKSRGNAAGDKAVKEKMAKLKKEGKSMSKEDKAQTRKDAMLNEYKRMGMSDKEIDTVMNDKGIKPSEASASAVAGSAISAIRSGSLWKSGNEKSASDEKETRFTSDEAKTALDNMDSEEERDAFMDKVDSGEIKVDRSTTNKMAGAAGAAKRGMSSAYNSAANSTAAKAASKAASTAADKGKQAAKKGFESAKKNAAAMPDNVKKGMAAAKKNIAAAPQAARNARDAAGKTFNEGIASARTNMTAAATSASEGMASARTNMAAAAKSAKEGMQAAPEKMRTAAASAKEGMGAAAKSAKEGIQAAPEKMKAAATSAKEGMQAAPEKMKAAAKSAKEGMGAAATSAKEGMKSAASSAQKGMKAASESASAKQIASAASRTAEVARNMKSEMHSTASQNRDKAGSAIIGSLKGAGMVIAGAGAAVVSPVLVPAMVGRNINKHGFKKGLSKSASGAKTSMKSALSYGRALPQNMATGAKDIALGFVASTPLHGIGFAVGKASKGTVLGVGAVADGIAKSTPIKMASNAASKTGEAADRLALGGEKGLEAEKRLVQSGAIKEPQKTGFKSLYSAADKKKIADLKETLTVKDPKRNVGAAADLRRHRQKTSGPDGEYNVKTRSAATTNALKAIDKQEEAYLAKPESADLRKALDDPKTRDEARLGDATLSKFDESRAELKATTMTRSEARAAALGNVNKARRQNLNNQLNETQASLKDINKKTEEAIPNRLKGLDDEEADYLENSASKDLKEALDDPETREEARKGDKTLAGIDRSRKAYKAHKADLVSQSGALKTREEELKKLISKLPPEIERGEDSVDDVGETQDFVLDDVEEGATNNALEGVEEDENDTALDDIERGNETIPDNIGDNKKKPLPDDAQGKPITKKAKTVHNQKSYREHEDFSIQKHEEILRELEVEGLSENDLVEFMDDRIESTSEGQILNYMTNQDIKPEVIVKAIGRHKHKKENS